MKKNRFFLLVAFALFVFIPFSVNAQATNEVIDKYDDVVYVIEESEYQDVLSVCDSSLTFNEDTIEFIPESRVGTVIVILYNDGTSEEIFVYDFATSSCQKGYDAYDSHVKDYYYDFREVYYYPDNGKLYKSELHPYLKSGYLPVAWENIEMDQKIYYTKHTAWLFYKVDDNSVCETEQCYRKMDSIELYSPSQIKNDVTYYTFNSSQGEFTTIVDNSTCESDDCYHEVNIDDYYTESSIADMDETKFDFAADGLDVGSIEITNYFELNGIGHIVFEDSNGRYLYTLDGKMVLPNDDNYTENNIIVVEDKYLINTKYHNDVSYKVTIYDDKYNIIYEKSYDHTGSFKEMDYYLYLTSFGNSSYLAKGHVSGDELSGEDNIKILSFVIRDYRLLEGANQTFEDSDLTFKTNGDLKRLEKVFVDNEEITNYTKREGSTIITLNKDYLNTLENGTHTLKITYGDGGYIETTFNVSKTSSETATPSTEIEAPDTSDPIVSSIFMGIISIFCLVVTTIYLKRKNNLEIK